MLGLCWLSRNHWVSGISAYRGIVFVLTLHGTLTSFTQGNLRVPYLGPIPCTFCLPSRDTLLMLQCSILCEYAQYLCMCNTEVWQSQCPVGSGFNQWVTRRWCKNTSLLLFLDTWSRMHLICVCWWSWKINQLVNHGDGQLNKASWILSFPASLSCPTPLLSEVTFLKKVPIYISLCVKLCFLENPNWVTDISRPENDERTVFCSLTLVFILRWKHIISLHLGDPTPLQNSRETSSLYQRERI